jgi:EpsI family protein
VSVAGPHLLAACTLVVLAMTASAVAPRPRPSAAPLVLEQSIPSSFAGWRLDASMVPVAPAPDVQARLEELYEQIVSRTYIDGSGRRVMLTIAYGGDQRDALRSHRQEVCYRAQGFRVQGMEPASLALDGRRLDVTRFHGVRGARSEPVTYWMTMGDQVITDRFDRLVAQMSYSVRTGAVPDGLLVRVSSLDADAGGGYALQSRFVGDLLRSVEPHVAARLTGGAQ